MGRQPGFFDLDERYAALSAAGDPLVKLRDVVPFEVFRYRIEKALRRSRRCLGCWPNRQFRNCLISAAITCGCS